MGVVTYIITQNFTGIAKSFGEALSRLATKTYARAEHGDPVRLTLQNKLYAVGYQLEQLCRDYMSGVGKIRNFGATGNMLVEIDTNLACFGLGAGDFPEHAAKQFRRRIEELRTMCDGKDFGPIVGPWFVEAEACAALIECVISSRATCAPAQGWPARE